MSKTRAAAGGTLLLPESGAAERKQNGDEGVLWAKQSKTELFESAPVLQALTVMAVPTIISQLIVLIYNLADTWFIGQTDNPYMVAAASLVSTVFLMITGLSNLFGVGGGNLVVQLLGRRREDEARRVASLSLVMAAGSALLFSVLCLAFMDPLLYLLGASENTIGYARQYLIPVVIIGAVPTLLANTMSTMLRNVGYSKEAGFGVSLGGLLNVGLDPLFMFVLLPKGYEVLGAALATLLSNLVSFVYFIVVYQKVRKKTVLALPRRIERVEKSSMRAIFAVGVPAALSLLLYDLTNIVINKLSSGHGDIELAAMGIILKVERLPLNICVGICLAMMPLVAYNYASGDRARMQAFFRVSRRAGLIVAAVCIALYWPLAPQIMRAFIHDEQTVALGTVYLRARCFAPIMMFLCFHIVHYMQALGKGGVSLALAAIRQLGMNIPLLFLLDHFFGMNGIIWTQVTADAMTAVISYLIYARVRRGMEAADGEKAAQA